MINKEKRLITSRRSRFFACLTGIVFFLCWILRAEAQIIKKSLEYVSPEEVGWSSEKLEQAKAFAEKINSAAVIPGLYLRFKDN